MKNLIICLIIAVIIAGCAGNKNYLEPVSNPKIIPVKKAIKQMETLINKIEEGTIDYKTERNIKKEALKYHQYHNSETLSYELSGSSDTEEFSFPDNLHNPVFSYNNGFVSAIEYDRTTTSKKGIEVTYKIKVYDTKSNNEATLFSCENDLYLNPDISEFFNIYAWHPFENIMVMTANEGRENNVYLGYFEFDGTLNEIHYIMIKLTDYDEDYSLMNYNWRYDGKSFTFTKFDGEFYEVYEYNLFDNTMKRIESDQEVVSFIYDNYKLKKGFAVIRKDAEFYPVFVEKISDTKLKESIHLTDVGFSKPFIFGSFAFYEEKVGYFAIDNKDNSQVACYNFGNEKLNFLLTKWEAYNKKVGYPLQITRPIWFFDKFLIFPNEKDISFIDTEIDTGNGLVIKDIVSNVGNYLNSLQRYDEIRLLVTHRELGKFSSNKYILRINEKISTPPLKARMIRATFNDILPSSNIKGITNVKRKGNAKRTSDFGATLGVINGKYLVEFRSLEEFEKASNGGTIYVRWSLEVKDRKFGADYRIPANPQDTSFGNIKIVN